jgi:very-short-patch-repair endonuclease
MKSDPRRVVLARAEEQYGVVTRAQAIAAGMKDWRVDRWVAERRLEPVFPGTYRVCGSDPSDRQRAMAALLWLGDDALLSQLTAAALLRLDGCRTDELHVTVLRSLRRRIKADDVHVHRVLQLPRQDRVTVDGLRSTSATRTVVDCAPLLSSEALEVAFESARRMGLTSPRALEQCAASVLDSGRPGAPALRELLAHQRPGERSLQYRLEVRMARLLRASELARPERQVKVGPYRIDFAYPSLMHGVECEGFDWHGCRLAWKRDKRRTSFLEGHGWSLTFVSWDDVTLRPDETLRRIAFALARARDPSACAYRRQMAFDRDQR